MPELHPRRAALRRSGFVTTALAVGCIAIAAMLGVGGASPASAAAPGAAPEPGVCDGCQPPLAYAGGPVLGTGTLTITPIYWAPAGYSFPGTYKTIVNRYIADIAAASGRTDNTYAINTEYYQLSGGLQQPIKYQIAAGTPIADTTPYPASGCTLKAPAKTCTTQAQYRAELTRVLAANHLAADLNHFYVLLFPPGTQTMDGTSRSNEGYCGIHGAYDLSPGPGTVVYANEPYISTGCTSGQSPNGNVFADTQVDTLSHEIGEAITDPGTSAGYAWFDGTGNEIGDECSYNYGPAIGSTNSAQADTTQYNQLINGSKYYTQTMFSNASYNANIGKGKGCLLGAYKPAAAVAVASPKVVPASPMMTPSTATLDASPTDVAADGSASSTITIEILDADGEPVVGDHVHFDVKTRPATPGLCGTLSHSDGVTDADGTVTTTFTASTENVACLVLGIDAENGASDATVIYQGTARSLAPIITDATVPVSITPGGDVETFSVTAANHSAVDIPDARFDLFLSGDNNGPDGSRGVTASQAHLSYSDPSTGGAFVDVPLFGETIGDGEIAGYIVPDTAADLAPGATRTVTFQLSLDAGAPTTGRTGMPLRIEMDLDQVNPADGSQSNLDYVGPADVNVGVPSDVITFAGTLRLLKPPTTRGTGTFASSSCTLVSAADGKSVPCTITASARLDGNGDGTLTGNVVSSEGNMSFSEQFAPSGSDTTAGTGTGIQSNIGKPATRSTITSSTTNTTGANPLVIDQQGEIVVSDE